ncbi:immunity protein 7 of polymorphic toxin system [Kineococcus xinjiangensis]|uniref:Immunity protein 7 of polymorphic toxin system n=1 Tax=Kineococcus xinjiangensis TaxID=512762 RepID=A0A2S6IH64_9ACTN|nr:Imm7 family immunity protein [Kineococcus xinjiangensis]PPK93541.1 immunity protein 7 of polymorphic toxin system [Kineococcus xinjiangensis]
MHGFHGWFDLRGYATCDPVTEAADDAREARNLRLLAGRVAQVDWSSGRARLDHFNGGHFLTVTGLIQRVRAEREELFALLRHVGETLPGSFGLLYEWADEFEDSNRYYVHRMVRGQIEAVDDPLLSPISPRLEDYLSS